MDKQLSPRPHQDVHITRRFAAPRALVFKAWPDPAMMANWWGPKMFTNPVCRVDARPGGALYIVMRAPDGSDYPMKGSFHQVEQGKRLVFTDQAVSAQGVIQLEGGHRVRTCGHFPVPINSFRRRRRALFRSMSETSQRRLRRH